MGWAMPLYAVSVFLVLVWTVTVERDRPTRARGPRTARRGRRGVPRGAAVLGVPRRGVARVDRVQRGVELHRARGSRTQGGGRAARRARGGARRAGRGLRRCASSSRLQQRWGLRRVYMLGCCVYADGVPAVGRGVEPDGCCRSSRCSRGWGSACCSRRASSIVGRLVPTQLYSTGNAITSMVGFGLGPILGAGVGGFVYERLGAGRAVRRRRPLLALAGAVVAWFALAKPGARSRTSPGRRCCRCRLPDTGPTV